jgi:hypothetical protein
MQYFDLKRNWRRIKPHQCPPDLNDILVREFDGPALDVPHVRAAPGRPSPGNRAGQTPASLPRGTAEALASVRKTRKAGGLGRSERQSA